MPGNCQTDVEENCINPALVGACRKMRAYFGLSTGHATAETERESESVKAQSGCLASPFQIPEVFGALEGLELIWLSGSPL